MQSRGAWVWWPDTLHAQPQTPKPKTLNPNSKFKTDHGSGDSSVAFLLALGVQEPQGREVGRPLLRALAARCRALKCAASCDNPHRNKVRQRLDRGWTEVRQRLDKGQTEVRHRSDKGQTRVRQESDRG